MLPEFLVGELDKFFWSLSEGSQVSAEYTNVLQNVQIICETHQILHLFVCFLWRCGPTRAMASSFLSFLDHTQRRTTVGRTSLDE